MEGPSTALPARSHFSPGTAVPVRLGESIDSGHLKNGQNLAATLLSPVRTSTGLQVPAGTPVTISVIATVPAGMLGAAGELSLQAVTVGSLHIFTDVQTFAGKPGHRDLPDSAAATGTDAGLPSGAKLTFHIQAPATDSPGTPDKHNPTPGSIDGIDSGAAPPKGATAPGSAGGSKGSNGAVKPVQPADNQFGPAQNLGKTSVAPNQPSKPAPSPTVNGPQ